MKLSHRQAAQELGVTSGPADDGDEMVGALLRFDAWRHLPTQNFVGGLWWVRSTLHMLGGEVHPTNRQAGGATFTVILPKRQDIDCL